MSKHGKEFTMKVDTSKVGETIAKATAGVSEKIKSVSSKTEQTIVNLIDENGNGEIDIEDIVVKGLRVPGIRINRAAFLQKELFKHYPQEVIDDAILFYPAHANIKPEDIDKIADEVIKYERNCVSGISAALGIPGGAAMVATIPADIAQYYGYMLRATQKLLYLYGFPEIDMSEKGANNALRAIAKALGSGVEKKLIRAALTKGTIYPIVKNVMKWFNVNLTKKVFAGFFKKAIPVIGGVIGGGITYLSFKPCCEKLRASLQNTLLSNPASQNPDEDNIILVETIQEESE